ncbi:hypothetical protein, partial [Streptococcus pneumoniae]|uniref:hypothetical protein n=1 Tax=Streptococcus pneumoniae TaxID=1313 RepID=UPI001E298CE7
YFGSHQQPVFGYPSSIEFVKRDDPSFLMPKMANRDRSPLSSSKSSSKAGLYGKIEGSDKRE